MSSGLGVVRGLRRPSGLGRQQDALPQARHGRVTPRRSRSSLRPMRSGIIPRGRPTCPADHPADVGDRRGLLEFSAPGPLRPDRDAERRLWRATLPGTLVGSSYLYATARDFARFGLLCLNDGVWLGERILPEGWVTYSTTPTPATTAGAIRGPVLAQQGRPRKIRKRGDIPSSRRTCSSPWATRARRSPSCRRKSSSSSASG